MTYEEALNQNINLSPIQAKNDLERYLLREEKPIPKAVAMGMKALEKQIMKKPDCTGQDEQDFYVCPVCKNFVGVRDDIFDENILNKYCNNCGQALDWSDT